MAITRTKNKIFLNTHINMKEREEISQEKTLDTEFDRKQN